MDDVHLAFAYELREIKSVENVQRALSAERQYVSFGQSVDFSAQPGIRAYGYVDFVPSAMESVYQIDQVFFTPADCAG